MTTVSDSQAERSRKNETLFLRHLASVGQARLAEAVGVHESTISKMKDEGRFRQFAAMLAVLNLKVVPEENKCFPPDFIDAVFTINRMLMDRKERPSQLEWD